MENKVELIGTYGSDEGHALSAWTSTSRFLNDKKRGRIGKLLGMLAREGHMTPFEKSSLHFLVTTDIATHIHLLKHRIGVSLNAESARYKEFKVNKYHIPIDWPKDEQDNLGLFIEDAFEHAQLEIRQVAAEMLCLVEEQGDFPLTIDAMRNCGMIPSK